VAWTHASWSMQQASRASQGASPGHPVYDTPQYLPYRINGACTCIRAQAVLRLARPAALLVVVGGGGGGTRRRRRAAEEAGQRVVCGGGEHEGDEEKLPPLGVTHYNLSVSLAVICVVSKC
jgi:hypothetical protein